MANIELKSMPASAARAVIGVCGISLIAIGAGLLWGAGGFWLSLGVVIYIDTATDEAVERFTGIRRGAK